MINYPNSLTLNYEVAASINRFVDIAHSFFPMFSFLAVWFLLESYLPIKPKFESAFDKFLTYSKLPFLAILILTLISQGWFGGCMIYYPQTWFNQTFLGVDKPYEYGLFGRQNIPQIYWPLLQLTYFVLSCFAIWRLYFFVKYRLLFPIHNQKLGIN